MRSSAFFRLVRWFHFSLRAIVEAWVICETSRSTRNKSDKGVTSHASPRQLSLEAGPSSLCDWYSGASSEPEATQPRYAANHPVMLVPGGHGGKCFRYKHKPHCSPVCQRKEVVTLLHVSLSCVCLLPVFRWVLARRTSCYNTGHTIHLSSLEQATENGQSLQKVLSASSLLVMRHNLLGADHSARCLQRSTGSASSFGWSSKVTIQGT